MRRYLTLVALGCRAPASVVANESRVPAPVAPAALPCLDGERDTMKWYAQMIAGHAWAAPWQVGRCTVVPHDHRAIGELDVLVREDGRTIAEITDCWMDFYIRTSLSGPQPGDVVGAPQVHDCERLSDDRRICYDGAGGRYVLQIGIDRVVARRADVCVDL